MVNSIKKLFGYRPVVDYKQLIREGAILLDVRTSEEYIAGHIEGAINIPVEKLRENLASLVNKQGIIIACCTNGSKSWYAKNLLDSTGYMHVYDGGSWTKLQRVLARN